jgi:hypothetical protein
MSAEDSERHPAERLASAVGKTPAEVAAMDRILTGLQEILIGCARLALEARETAESFKKLGLALAGLDARLDMDAIDIIASDPDLVELDVYLDGFYA